MESSRTKTDRALVQRAMAGDQRAFSSLMSHYKGYVRRSVLKLVHHPDDADDLTMEAIGKAFTNLDKYNPEFAFSTWIMRITLNHCIDFNRKKNIKNVSSDMLMNIGGVSGPDDGALPYSLGDKLLSTIANPEETYVGSQRKGLLRGVLSQLKPTYRKLIEMRHFDELSYDEIAAEMELSPGTVKAKIFRAKEILAHLLKNVKHQY